MSHELALARLERRAARENAARREAEATAEIQIRRVREHAREVELLGSIAAIVNESENAESALTLAAKAIRRHCRFAVAHVLVPDESGALASADIWDADASQVEFLERVITSTLDKRFIPPQDLPGQVSASHQTLWLADIRQTAQFAQRPEIASGAAWAFPVLAGVEVVAVIEFFDPRTRTADERLLALAPAFGTQLGKAVEWDRIRQREAQDRRRLEELLAQRTREAQEVERTYAVADQARDSFVAYLAHDARQRMARAADSARDRGQDAVESVRGLEDVLERLVRVVDRSDRRFAGERVAVPLTDLATAVRVSQDSFDPGAVEVRVVGHEDAVIELNVDLMTKLTALVLSHISATSDSDSVLIEMEVSPDNLAATISSSAAFDLWDTEARITGDDEISQAARLAKALGGFLTVSQSERLDHVVRVVVATQYNEQGSAKVSNRRILLVDDNEINRKIAGAMLSRLGLEADVVNGGLPALDSMAEREYGLILMDVSMPDLDGRDATRRWRAGTGGATRVDVPIVAVTAHVAESERVECLSAGMNDYLSKPFGLEGLQATVRRWIRDNETSDPAE
jgi:CheY-like chemotaxis protein